MFSKRSKWLILLLSLVLVPVGNAGPTKTDCVFRHIYQCTSFHPLPHVCSCADVTDNIDIAESRLERIGSDFLKPPDDFTGSAQSTVPVQSLPAVPGALLLALTGFICVSLVKDYKLWLTAVAGLLWVGQSGFHAVPHLAMRLGHRMHNHRQFAAELMYPYYLQNARLRCDMEGSSYIGLLRYLEGIPGGKISLLQKKYSRHADNEVRAHQPALIEISSRIITALNCLTVKIRPFTCFSQASIFQNLPRAPPKIT